MRAALLQMTSADDPAESLRRLLPLVGRAADEGADLLCTPEVTNMVAPRATLQARAVAEEADPVLCVLRGEAARRGVWIAVGSLALRDGDRLVNRSLLLDPAGAVAARYDKVHMFDVDLPDGESHRESDAFRPGDRLVVARTPLGALGLAVCYDLRFPHLHRALAQAGAEVILNPAAFTVPTGRAHWEVLLRARAIETGAWVLAAAQCGDHGHGRRTWGRSLAVAPWGEVAAEGGEAPGVTLVDLDLALVAEARRRVPSLRHDRAVLGP